MRRLSVITAFLLLIFCACPAQTTPALSDVQKATIEEEVIAQHDVFISALTRNNYKDWLACYSKDNFVSALTYPVVDPFDYEQWMLAVKDGFSDRIKHKTDLYQIIVTPLSPDLAVSTQFGIWQNWYKNSPNTKNSFHATFLWKKETDGWKIIHVNETGFPNFEQPASYINRIRHLLQNIQKGYIIVGNPLYLNKIPDSYVLIIV